MIVHSSKNPIIINEGLISKFKDKVYKSCKSLVLSRELLGDKFVLSTTCLMTNTEIIFKGYISDDGQSIDFKLFDVVTTTYMVV